MLKARSIPPKQLPLHCHFLEHRYSTDLLPYRGCFVIVHSQSFLEEPQDCCEGLKLLRVCSKQHVLLHWLTSLSEILPKQRSISIELANYLPRSSMKTFWSSHDYIATGLLDIFIRGKQRLADTNVFFSDVVDDLRSCLPREDSVIKSQYFIADDRPWEYSSPCLSVSTRIFHIVCSFANREQLTVWAPRQQRYPRPCLASLRSCWR